MCHTKPHKASDLRGKYLYIFYCVYSPSCTKKKKKNLARPFKTLQQKRANVTKPDEENIYIFAKYRLYAKKLHFRRLMSCTISATSIQFRCLY